MEWMMLVHLRQFIQLHPEWVGTESYDRVIKLVHLYLNQKQVLTKSYCPPNTQDMGKRGKKPLKRLSEKNKRKRRSRINELTGEISYIRKRILAVRSERDSLVKDLEEISQIIENREIDKPAQE